MKAELTKTESKVTLLVTDGKSDREIGLELGMEKSTVQSHMRAIYLKTGCNRRAGLTRWAIKEGLVKV